MDLRVKTWLSKAYDHNKKDTEDINRKRNFVNMSFVHEDLVKANLNHMVDNHPDNYINGYKPDCNNAKSVNFTMAIYYCVLALQTIKNKYVKNYDK